MPTRNIEDVSRDFIKDYTIYVTKNRVLPHLDFKPVQRRIIWSMIKMNARFNKGGFRKVSSVIGTVMWYHPHGDKSIADTIVKMVKSPNAMVSGRGNYGNIYGDPEAAPRYIECRTSEAFESIFDNSMFDVSEFVSNYDETDIEPLIIPTKIPIPLLTGVSGIGIGLTTNSPAYSFDSVKSMVLNELNSEPLNIEYAYKGGLFNNRIYPDISLFKDSSGKEYLHITDIPINSAASFINEGYLRQLVTSGQIEIIDESSKKEVSIKIYAPLDIQTNIIMSLSKPIINNFLFFWKKLRRSGFVNEWLVHRRSHIEKREYFNMMKEWKSYISKLALTEISKSSNIKDNLDNIVNNILSKEINDLPTNPEVTRLIPTSCEFLKLIKDKPISSIKEYTLNKVIVSELKADDIDNIIRDEINNLDRNLFTKPTKVITSIPSCEFKDTITRYIAQRGNSIEVRYTSIPRVVNWKTPGRIQVIFNNGKVETLWDYFTGIYEPPEGEQIVGFTFPNTPTVIITESNNLAVYSRLSAVKELIKSAFPAKKIEVDGKEYDTRKSISLSDIKHWKVLEP